MFNNELIQLGRGSKKSYGGYKKGYEGYDKHESKYGDYKLTVGGNIISSRIDTSSDHDARIRGDVNRSNVHNYYGGISPGLAVIIIFSMLH